MSGIIQSVVWFVFYVWYTVDGVFSYCYLVLTWSLSARAANTAYIRFTDSSFDSFAVAFSHSKTDQLGDESKFVCPVLAMGLFSTAASTRYSRILLCVSRYGSVETIWKILGIVLKQNVHLVNELGFKLSGIGTKSARKGTVSYLSSLMPGGPSCSAAVCIRAGWMMGKVTDTYICYVISRDQFVGICLCLLPRLSAEFGCSLLFLY